MRKCRTKASSDGLIVGGRNIANGIGRRHRIGIIGRRLTRTETTTDDVSSVRHRVSWRPLIEGHGSK